MNYNRHSGKLSMLYRPAFCCNCGEKVVRDEWRFWTSRRFCALCETEHKGIDLVPKAIVAIGLLLSAAGFASYLRMPAQVAGGSTFRPQETRQNLKPATLNSSNNTISEPIAGDQNSNLSPAAKQQINEQPQREKRTSEEQVFYCGAITKKGTPCTRRVKTKGFCWQHAKSGQIAPARF